MVTLPAELIDHVFSFLQTDIPSLKACSKAHPLYSRLAERHIYAQIVTSEVFKDILENPHLLDYPRTLEIRRFARNPLAIPIVSVIPRMANLISLKIQGPCSFSRRYESSSTFFSTFINCIQQSSFQEFHLFHVYDISISFLDDARNIKQLALINCTTDRDEQISDSSLSQLSLDSLILSSNHNPYLYRWVMRWVTRLTSLELRDVSLDLDWTGPELLVACSNSLTRLHLDVTNICMRYLSRYKSLKFTCLIGYDDELPFTLSALVCLKRLSISAQIIGKEWALPGIIRVVNTAPIIPNVVLWLDCFLSDSLASLGGLDWSVLDQLQINSTGKRPRIDLCVTGEGYWAEGILDALAANEALMDLVRRDLVTLRSERVCPGPSFI